jgi:hypothetical protein
MHQGAAETPDEDAAEHLRSGEAARADFPVEGGREVDSS